MSEWQDLDELLEQLPEPMRRDLEATGDEDFMRVEAIYYLEADPVTRKDMLAFHESAGPEKMHEAKLKLREGTPTTAELEDAYAASPSVGVFDRDTTRMLARICAGLILAALLVLALAAIL